MTKAVSKQSASKGHEGEPLRLKTVDRGRLMVATSASSQTIDAWWQGKPVKPITARALETAARRLRIAVPQSIVTADRGEIRG